MLLTLANQGTLQGVEAVNCLLEATPETPSYMIGICENKITKIPLVQAVKQVYYLSLCWTNCPDWLARLKQLQRLSRPSTSSKL